MMKNSPRALQTAIQAVLAGYEEGINGFEAEISCFGASFETEDFKEGTRAFSKNANPNSRENEQRSAGLHSKPQRPRPAGLCDALKRRHGRAGQVGNSGCGSPVRTN